jgi:hypothetical protein
MSREATSAADPASNLATADEARFRSLGPGPLRTTSIRTVHLAPPQATMNATFSPRLAALAAAALCAASLAFAAPAAAQATSPGVTVPPQEENAEKPRRDRNQITREEIAERNVSNAYDLVRTLRPAWLRGRRGDSSFARSTAVAVYQEGMRMGGPEALRSIPTASIVSIQYYDAVSATQRFGSDHGGGAIVVMMH